MKDFYTIAMNTGSKAQAIAYAKLVREERYKAKVTKLTKGFAKPRYLVRVASGGTITHLKGRGGGVIAPFLSIKDVKYYK